MKHFLLSLSFLLTAAFSWAQCDPIFDFGDAEWGVAPDTVTNLNDGQINSVYFQQIDVLVPIDGEPFGSPIPIVVDSATLAQVNGLPAGLTFECNSPLATPCTFLGGSQGCGVISGIPTEAGVFDLDITVQVFYDLLGNAASLPVLVEGYRIEISDPLSDGLEERATEFKLFPNPAQTACEIRFDYNQTENVLITIYDIVGKQTYSEQQLAKQGNNTFQIPVQNLKEGTYIVRVDGSAWSSTKRLVVSK